MATSSLVFGDHISSQQQVGFVVILQLGQQTAAFCSHVFFLNKYFMMKSNIQPNEVKPPVATSWRPTQPQEATVPAALPRTGIAGGPSCTEMAKYIQGEAMSTSNDPSHQPDLCTQLNTTSHLISSDPAQRVALRVGFGSLGVFPPRRRCGAFCP